jgi:hypothetical protein
MPAARAGTDFFLAEFANASALNLLQLYRDAHEHDGQGSDFYRRVPAVEIRGGIRFRDAQGLRAANRFGERAAFLHFREHHVGGGIQHAGKTAQFRGGQAHGEHGKNRCAVHHRSFVEKLLFYLLRQSRKLAERVNDRSLVGGDGVHAEFERGADVVDSGLAGLHVQRAGFK